MANTSDQSQSSSPSHKITKVASVVFILIAFVIGFEIYYLLHLTVASNYWYSKAQKDGTAYFESLLE
jgi:hypothetical protein